MTNTIQGTAEWLAERCGKATASRMGDLMARTKTGHGASRANYMAELIAERLTGRPTETYTNAAMQWGHDKEPEARAAYEFLVGADVEQVGFIPHPSLAMTGASPDGLVGERGMIEIKCPSTATHIDTLLSGVITHRYVLQMHWQMECCGRDWCDFVSFDPRLPMSMQVFIQRVERDAALTAEMLTEVATFLRELDDKVSALTAKFERREAA